MSKVLTAVAVLGALPFAAGTVGGDFVFSLYSPLGIDPIASKRGAETTVTFEDVAPGTYTVQASRVDSNGVPLGTAVVSDPFTIVDEPATVTIDVPASVTVSVA